MGGYSVYNPVRSNLIRNIGCSFSKKERKHSGFPRMVVSEFFRRSPSFTSTIEGRILAEELDWQSAGCPMYFPESLELVDMLWRSKMNVRIEDLELDKMPRAFSIAWPNHLVDGVQPMGCMIWWGDGQNWKEALIRMEREYCRGMFGDIRGIAPPDLRLGLHMSFCKEDAEAQRFGVKHSYYRASVPNDLFVSGLASCGDFEQTFKKYNSPSLVGVLPLTPEEVHIQYVTFKLAIRMLVYMRACPQHIREGYPGGKNHKAFEGRWDEFKPNVIGMPVKAGTHESPVTHLRTWHFRSYPIKHDGTRRNGVVFVNATVVNAEVDPVTVEDGGSINGDAAG